MSSKKNKTLKLFVGGATPYANNRGNAAIFSGLLGLFRQFQDYSFKITVWHSYPESMQRHLDNMPTTTSINHKTEDKLAVNVVYYTLPSASFRTYLVFIYKLFISIEALLINRLLKFLHLGASAKIEVVKELDSTDAIIELNFGDTFTDVHYGKIIWLVNLLRFSMESLSNKPIYFFPQSIGPFKSIFSKAIASIALKKTKMLTIREQYSLKCVTDLGVNKEKIYSALDMSFWSELITKEDAKKILKTANIVTDRRLVGILLTEKFFVQKKASIDVIAQSIDHIMNEFKVAVVFIPHGNSDGGNIDSYKLSLSTYKLLKDHDNAFVMSDDYSVEDIWGVIGQCDLIISMLTHPVLSALRQGVPVIALSYSHKTLGIMKMFNMDSYLLSYAVFDEAELMKMVRRIFDNYESVKDTLLSNHDLTLKKMDNFQNSVHAMFETLSDKGGLQYS